MADIDEILEMLGGLRYGMSTNEKEKIAARGSIPGSPIDRTPDKRFANRYTAGFAHANAFPTASKFTLPVANFIHGLFGDTVQNEAQLGAEQAWAQQLAKLKPVKH